MITFNNTIQIKQPIDRVFSFLSKFEYMPKWNYYIMQVTPLNRRVGPIEGARYHVVRKNDEHSFRVIDINKNQSITIKSLPSPSTQFQRSTTLNAIGDETILHDQFEVNTRLPTFIEKLAVNKMKNAVMENLRKLKELLETGITTLQDGRVQRI